VAWPGTKRLIPDFEIGDILADRSLLSTGFAIGAEPASLSHKGDEPIEPLSASAPGPLRTVKRWRTGIVPRSRAVTLLPG
jgi:hypothetical protein